CSLQAIDSYALRGLVPSNVCFSDAYLSHRDLPSFPTRRSSDLGFGSASCTHCAMTSSCAHGRKVPRPRSSCTRPICRRASSPSRSEEHTSELQSRGHLVCRLLLEKKNCRNGRNNVPSNC